MEDRRQDEITGGQDATPQEVSSDFMEALNELKAEETVNPQPEVQAVQQAAPQPVIPQQPMPVAQPVYQQPVQNIPPQPMPIYQPVQTPYTPQYMPPAQQPVVYVQQGMPGTTVPQAMPMQHIQPVYTAPVIPQSLLPKDFVPEDPQVFEAASDASDIENMAAVDVPEGETFNRPVTAAPTANNHGLRVFCIMLAFVIVICTCLTAGYYIGKDRGTLPSYNGTAIDIVPRPQSDGMSIADVTKTVSKSLVSIIAYSPDGSSAANATGIVLNSEGYILTNDHVGAAMPASKFQITTQDGRTAAAEFYAGDQRSDIAILKCDIKDLTPAVFGDSNGAVVGEPVVAIGYPSTPDVLTTTDGIISAVNRRITNSSNHSMPLLQTNAAISPGSSGGPLCNMHGQVIGVVSSKLVSMDIEGVGFAIPSVTAKSIADSLIKNKYVADRARLGITYTFNSVIASEMNKYPVGLVIVTLEENSAFKGTQAAVEDIIVEINGNKITSAEMVLEAIAGSKPGDNLQFTLYRPQNKQTFTATAKLIEDRGMTGRQENMPSSESDPENPNKEFDFPFGE